MQSVMADSSRKLGIGGAILLLIGNIFVFWLAVSLPQAGALQALWATLPVVAVLPVLVLARTPTQESAVLLVGTLTLLVSFAFQWELRANSDPFNYFASWVAPAAQLAATIVALLVATLLVGALARGRNAAP